jgi:hypothetical protein
VEEESPHREASPRFLFPTEKTFVSSAGSN